MMDTHSSSRPQHHRNASSKTNILRALVSSKASSSAQGTTNVVASSRTKSMPMLPVDHPHHATKGAILGERKANMQSPPPSPSKSRKAEGRSVKVPTKTGESSLMPKKTKSSTNLSAVFAKINRSSKDLPRMKDKENTTPPSSSNGPSNPPIWAQFATADQFNPRPISRDSESSHNIHDEIARYTPQEYSPGKQRNFNGTLDQPNMRPTLGARSRPQSAYVLGEGIVGAIGRRVSGERVSLEHRRSEDRGSKRDKVHSSRVSGEASSTDVRKTVTERKISASSTEQVPLKEKLNIAKRGGRVMAAVAALQGKSKEQVPAKQEPAMDPHAIDEQFEAVLAARQIPEPMRQKMRSLTMRVKADFIKQDQEHIQSASRPTGKDQNGSKSQDAEKAKAAVRAKDAEANSTSEEDSKATKRSRTRSRTFTFSRSDKRGEGSPSKKQRSQSRSRPTSIHIPKDTRIVAASTPTTTTSGSLGRKSAPPAIPADYITYLRQNQDPTKVEVGRLHKLRILLRNETVAWVDSFVSQDGMAEIVGLLHRIMELEWREEHEDQLLHETLLCLKGLCTTERAMAELDKIANDLFPALLGMLFDEEKKGPAEYNTRTIITTVLFNYLASASSSFPKTLEHRAQRILSFLAEPQKPENARPVDFVLDMRVSRPYKTWCREVSNVTKEVFWIFLHHLNVVPVPRPTTSDSPDTDPAERAKIMEATFTTRHFPGSRPPVPAAPYIGGVEWDATTYLTSHLDLLNGLLASLPSSTARNELREEMRASGYEKVMGATLRTCKEKFYSGVHDGLRAWVAAAVEDGWETRFVREGPTDEEILQSSPRKSPKKKADAPPQLEAPKLDLDIGLKSEGKGSSGFVDEDDDGWLG